MNETAAVTECKLALRDAKRLAEDDPEVAHINADDALRGLLCALGLEAIATLYDEIQPKWYA